MGISRVSFGEYTAQVQKGKKILEGLPSEMRSPPPGDMNSAIRYNKEPSPHTSKFIYRGIGLPSLLCTYDGTGFQLKQQDELVSEFTIPELQTIDKRIITLLSNNPINRFLDFLQNLILHYKGKVAKESKSTEAISKANIATELACGDWKFQIQQDQLPKAIQALPLAISNKVNETLVNQIRTTDNIFRCKITKISQRGRQEAREFDLTVEPQNSPQETGFIFTMTRYGGSVDKLVLFLKSTEIDTTKNLKSPLMLKLIPYLKDQAALMNRSPDSAVEVRELNIPIDSSNQITIQATGHQSIELFQNALLSSRDNRVVPRAWKIRGWDKYGFNETNKTTDITAIAVPNTSIKRTDGNLSFDLLLMTKADGQKTFQTNTGTSFHISLPLSSTSSQNISPVLRSLIGFVRGTASSGSF